MQALTSKLTEEGTNADFELTERSTECNEKITIPVYSTQNKNKTQEPSGKITPTVLDTTKSKTKVTKVAEITDIPKISNIDKVSHPRFEKIIEFLDTPALRKNSGDQDLTKKAPPTVEFIKIKKVTEIQEPESIPIPPNEPLAIHQTLMLERAKYPDFQGRGLNQ